jgi:hypothetical protein
LQAKYADQADAQTVLGYLELMNTIKNCERPGEGITARDILSIKNVLDIYQYS